MTLPAAPTRALLGALAAAAMFTALAAPARAKESERADFDARPAAPATAQQPGARARDALRQRLGRFGALSLDRHAGTLRSVGRLDGFLTGPSGRDGAAVALAYAREHAAAFGLDGNDLDGLRLVDREFVNGIEHLAWEQRYEGIPAADAGLQAAVTGSGRLVNLTGPPAADLAVRSIAPSVGAAQAYAAARESGGDPSPAAAVVHRDGGAEQVTRFADGGRASLTLYRSGSGHRLAWRVLAPVSSTGVYDVLVDARSGQAVRRANRVKFGVPAKVFRNNPATGAQVDADFAPWLTSTDRLEGPNAHAFTDVHDVVGAVTQGGFGVAPEAGSDVAPVAGGYQFPLTFAPNFAGDGCPSASPCTWDPRTGGANSWAANKQQSAAQLFSFVNTFHDHLRDAPGIEFVAGGFRTNPGQPRGNPNTSAPPTASDPVLAQTLDGADTAAGFPDADHVNNANFLTLPDGYPGFMQMYLWKPPFGGYDGSNDAGMVFHEYTHGMTDRLVTDAAGYGALTSPQAGAMSEGFSDFYAIDYLVAEGLLPNGSDADLRFGRYLDNATGTLVRRQSIDCVAATTAPGCPDALGPAGAGAFTYADFGKITSGGPDVHDDGEIWGQTLWSLRSALIDAHGEEAGVARARQYITQALRLSPPEPSFLEMRNAILEAAPPENGDDDLLWSVFAARGMGYFAATDGGDDVAPVADITDPADLTGTATISGTVRDEALQPVAGATVGVAGFDAGLGPDHTDVTAPDGTYAFEVPALAGGTSTYPAVRARKPAFLGDREELVAVEDGQTTTIPFDIERDWSSTAPGAGTAEVRAFTGPDHSTSGCGPGGLVDDDPGVVWGTDNVAGGRRIVVDLGAPIDVARVLIDPAAGCGDDASSALGQYRLEAATGPDGPFTVLPSTGPFTADDNGTLSTAFTGTAPRVRFVALHALAPQDATPGGSGEDYIDVAEMHVARQPNTSIGPATETTGASSVGITSARLAGTVTPHDGAADVVFQYGTSTAYGATVSAGSVPAGSTAKVVAATVGGLAPGTTYHFRAVARRGGGDYPGADRTFRTAPAPPPPPRPTPTPTPAPTVTPTATPTPTPTTFSVGRKLTASRKGVFKVKVEFGNRAPAGTARLRVLAGKRRLAVGRFAVRPERTVTKTLTLNRRGRRMIRAGRSRKVTLELRLPDGSKVKQTVRLARRKR